jgi:hypothetical protein
VGEGADLLEAEQPCDFGHGHAWVPKVMARQLQPEVVETPMNLNPWDAR